MKIVNGALVFAVIVLTALIPSLLWGRANREGRWWGFTALAILCLGLLLAAIDRDKLPEEEAKRLRSMGYIPGVTSALGPRNARIFCALLTAWLSAAGVRAYLYFGW